MARRSSVWSEIAKDREARRKRAERAERTQAQIARELQADARRAAAIDEREAKSQAKHEAETEKIAGLTQAKDENARLNFRVDELATVLRSAVANPSLSVREATQVVVEPFDPGSDGKTLPRPQEPILEQRGFLGRSRRQREHQVALDHYATEVSEYQRRERERRERLQDRRSAHQRASSDAKAASDTRAERLRESLRDGEEETVEAFVCSAIEAVAMPEGVDLKPRAVYRPDPREIVIDIELPGLDVVPDQKSVDYVHARREFKVKARPRTEIANL